MDKRTTGKIFCGLNKLRVQLDDLFSRLDHCEDFNHKPDICRYGKAEFPARVLPCEMQITDFLFWYYRICYNQAERNEVHVSRNLAWI